MPISSTRNPAVTFARSLQRSPVRRDVNAYLAEGVRLLDEAMRSGQVARLVLYDSTLLARTPAGARLAQALPAWSDEVYEVSEHVLCSVSATETPAGAIAVLSRPTPPPLSDLARGTFGVILDGVHDPGNVGTIARTAYAAGAGYLVATPGTADAFSPKVVRAGMGAHFHLPILTDRPWSALREELDGVPLIACQMDGETSVFDATWSVPGALVVGSEAHGLSREARESISYAVRIPMRDGVESLNASVAAGIALYQAMQRRIEVEDERYK